MALAPSSAAIWIAAPPMPPAAPWISTFMPGARPARITRVWATVKKVSGRAAASAQRPAVGHGQHLAGGHRDIFGVAAAIGERHDLVADCQP